MNSIWEKIRSNVGARFWCAFAFCAMALLAQVGLLLAKPGIFAAGGARGVDEWREMTPAGVRFCADTERYIHGAEHVLAGEPLEAEQPSYRGYIWLTAACIKTGIGLTGLIALQVGMLLATLLATMALALRLGGWKASAIVGAAFVLNAELAAWACFVSTDIPYTAAVCFATWLLLAPTVKCPWTYGLAFVALFLCATLRPTGWILLPTAGIFWSLRAPLRGRWRALLCGAVIVLFFGCAFGLGNARRGIGDQSPIVKLYTGEVIWCEDTWRVQMPTPPQEQTYAAAFGYIVRHPVACTWLALKRAAVMILKVRPAYSWKHNALLLILYLPLTVLAIAGAVRHRKNPIGQAAIALVAAHTLVVMLTFNDYDGRFTLYIMPLLALLAASVFPRETTESPLPPLVTSH
ncbi:MAG: hypothetical protein IJJ26_09875 [Victivallales bacterium]|nr:hypothetical protein [Victivallales bacterium]